MLTLINNHNPGQSYLSKFRKWRSIGLVFVFFSLVFSSANAQIYVQDGTQVKVSDNTFIHSTDSLNNDGLNEGNAVIYVSSGTKFIKSEEIKIPEESIQHSLVTNVKKSTTTPKTIAEKKEEKYIAKEIPAEKSIPVVFKSIPKENNSFLSWHRQSKLLTPPNNFQPKSFEAKYQIDLIDLAIFSSQRKKQDYNYHKAVKTSFFLRQNFSRPPPSYV